MRFRLRVGRESGEPPLFSHTNAFACNVFARGAREKETENEFGMPDA